MQTQPLSIQTGLVRPSKFIAAFFVVFCLMIYLPVADAHADEVSASKYDDLKEAIANAPTDGQERTIYIMDNFTWSSDSLTAETLVLSTGSNIIIQGNEGWPYAISRPASGTLFNEAFLNVSSGASLLLNKIVFSGIAGDSQDAQAPLIIIQAGGECTIEAGATLERNANRGTNSKGGAIQNAGTCIIAGAKITNNTAESGGGIYNTGTLTLKDGALFKENEATGEMTSPYTDFNGIGGAIYNGSGGKITIDTDDSSPILISSNSAKNAGGGIANEGTVTLKNCSILENNAELGGGGIVNNGALYIKAGTTISDNKATNTTQAIGGGVLNWKDGFLSMEAGEISENTSAYNGGGLAAYGDCKISGGSIKKNLASDCGGGLYLRSPSETTFEGGSIEENTCLGNPSADINSRGGGVDISGGTLLMQGGSVINNESSIGGGISIYNGGSSHLVLSDGIISGNTAENGGGVAFYYVGGIPDAPSDFTMNGASITGNSASADGGGILCVAEGIFTMSAGTVNGNTAGVRGGALFHDGRVTVSGDITLGDSVAKGAVYLNTSRTISIAQEGLDTNSSIYIEEVAETTKEGRVVATKLDGSMASANEATSFSYVPGSYSVVAREQTSDYILAGNPALTVTPTSLTFGKTALGQKSVSQKLLVEGAALGEDISWTVPEGFIVEKGADWDPRLGGTLLVSFEPKKAGTTQGTIEFTSTSLVASVSLSGTTTSDSGENLAATSDSTTPTMAGLTILSIMTATVLLLVQQRQRKEN